MGQEFFIKSDNLESKIRQLLPSQGGLGAGFDLSASTQIVPIVDLTESAEGSDVRPDLQTALSFDTITAFDVSSGTTTIVNNTGYYRVFGALGALSNTSTSLSAAFRLNDGSSTKNIVLYTIVAGTGSNSSTVTPFDFNVFLKAGDFLEATTSSAAVFLRGSTRQIADIDGNLVNP